jgi:hypothetical protein
MDRKDRIGRMLVHPSGGGTTRLDDRPNGSPTIIGYKKLDTSLIEDRSLGSSSSPPLRKVRPDKGMKGRWFDGYLRVTGWESEYASVQKLLDHLSRRTKSESSRIQYLQTLATLCRREQRTPDQLVRLSRHEAEDAVQIYLDDMAKRGNSKRWINASMHQLITFFRGSGFRKQKELELEHHWVHEVAEDLVPNVIRLENGKFQATNASSGNFLSAVG